MQQGTNPGILGMARTRGAATVRPTVGLGGGCGPEDTPKAFKAPPRWRVAAHAPAGLAGRRAAGHGATGGGGFAPCRLVAAAGRPVGKASPGGPGGVRAVLFARGQRLFTPTALCGQPDAVTVTGRGGGCQPPNKCPGRGPHQGARCDGTGAWPRRRRGRRARPCGSDGCLRRRGRRRMGRRRMGMMRRRRRRRRGLAGLGRAPTHGTTSVPLRRAGAGT